MGGVIISRLQSRLLFFNWINYLVIYLSCYLVRVGVVVRIDHTNQGHKNSHSYLFSFLKVVGLFVY